MVLSKNKTPGFTVSDEGQSLDTMELDRMEKSFYEWVNLSPRPDVAFSRQRILIIFLLIRYTGAKLKEVLGLNPFHDIDTVHRVISFRGNLAGTKSGPRKVEISETLSLKIEAVLKEPFFKDGLPDMLNVDPGFVRRKFYERAETCGFPKHLAGPEMIRRARGVELMQGNMPLQAVQMMLGHTTASQTSAYASFSEDEIRQVTRIFIERESMPRTSARNSFFGKIQTLCQGDIQTRVDMTTMDGHSITTVITNDSVKRLGLKRGGLVTAEVKAPWVLLQAGDIEPQCSAENRFKGVIKNITTGRINTEYAVKISDGTTLCSIVSTVSPGCLKLKEGDVVWVFFNCFSVVLHVDQ